MTTSKTTHAAVLRSRDFLGRDVLDAGGNKVGSIKDLLLDRRSGSIRFLDVDLGVFRKKVIIPVDRVDWGEESFVLRGLSAEHLQRLPPYDADRPLTGAMLDELVWAYPAFYGDEEPPPPAASGVEPQIVPMRDAKDFKVRDEEPDLRGWNVFGSDGERVGKVADLLVDPAAMKVAYLDVDVHDDLYSLKDDRHIVIPTNSVDLRERGKDVWIRDLPAADVARLPAYHGGRVDPLVMDRVADAFSPRTRYEDPPPRE